MRSSTLPAARAVEHTYVLTKIDLQADILKFYVAIFQNASKKVRGIYAHLGFFPVVATVLDNLRPDAPLVLREQYRSSA
ncbi:hypothetical protein PISMIDRAFT_19386 [Pisolithus microcarpus 441]|uniref:Uncharacterized protein n=1 Tax=Pisolithus microcarpus 441 TaxID=765257 RepID=A0A0C9XH44_9AGAM|nr:hypothetical protein BKA83DRAFT_19386 [Pisolithus microcarpus]KIK11615.1 hypothetical protein PISMIDRAFT_19386 [Pisolithus microcarpus 441]